jgi:hypothetical protein
LMSNNFSPAMQPRKNKQKFKNSDIFCKNKKHYTRQLKIIKNFNKTRICTGQSKNRAFYGVFTRRKYDIYWGQQRF